MEASAVQIENQQTAAATDKSQCTLVAKSGLFKF